jgi:hypothetical protein
VHATALQVNSFVRIAAELQGNHSVTRLHLNGSEIGSADLSAMFQVIEV